MLLSLCILAFTASLPCAISEQNQQEIFVETIWLIKDLSNLDRKEPVLWMRRFKNMIFRWSRDIDETLTYLHHCGVTQEENSVAQSCSKNVFNKRGIPVMGTGPKDLPFEITHPFRYAYLCLMPGGYSKSLLFVFTDSDLDLLPEYGNLGKHGHLVLKRLRDEYGTYIVTFDLDPDGSQNHYLKDDSDEYYLFKDYNATTAGVLFKKAMSMAGNRTKTAGAVFTPEWFNKMVGKPWFSIVLFLIGAVAFALLAVSVHCAIKRWRKNGHESTNETVAMKSFNDLHQEHQLQC